MSTSTLTYETTRSALAIRSADYLELTKPRIATLVLITMAVAAFTAGVHSPAMLIHALLGTALVAASASALNQWLERHTDALMPRTADRPLPAGRLSGGEVLWFSWVTIIAGVLYLALAVNLVTAALGLLTWVLYVWVYTPLKTRSPINTVVGAVAGALPVLMGWSAAGGSFSLLDPTAGGLLAATLFVVLFLWQFPHFMAIAWIYRQQYGQAGLQMLTVVEPTGRRAGAQAVVAALMMIPVSLVPTVHWAGPAYFAIALLLGLGYLAASIVFCLRRDNPSARRLLWSSLIYLPAMLVLMLLLPRIQ